METTIGQVSYPEWVPHEINADHYPSLKALFDYSVTTYGRAPAFSSFGKHISYQQFDQLASQLANYWLYQAKLQPGDRVALMMPNLLQYPIAVFAAFKAGLVVVNINPLSTARELQHQLIDSGAKGLIILANFAHTFANVGSTTPVEHVIVTELGDLLGGKGKLINFVLRYVKRLVPKFNLPAYHGWHAALAAQASLPTPDIVVNGTDLAFLQYTGGTTGLSKGAMLSHRNLIANLEQAYAWIERDIKIAEEVIITALPLYHIFALTANLLMGVKIGAKNILVANPRDFPAFVKLLRKEKFTYFTGVNTLFNALLHTPKFADIDFSHLHVTLGGGTAVQQSVAEAWQQTTGVVLLEAYGLTEASPAVCINPLSLDAFNGKIGLALPSTEISVRDSEGQPLDINQPGELWVRGPQVMQGYWQKPEETANVLSEDGWLKTGDIAEIDDAGYVAIVDRLKDLVLVSGFNVYPNEIEAVLASHDKVLESGVIGVDDAHSGEAVKAFIVATDDTLDEASVRTFCAQHLSAYKRPKHIVFVDALPKSNVGKILRRELRTL